MTPLSLADDGRSGGGVLLGRRHDLDLQLEPSGEGDHLDQSIRALAEVDRIKLVNPRLDRLDKGDDGLFRMMGDEEAVADANVRIVPGALEGSNVNPVDALVKMIALARRFELEVKIMSAAEENATAAASIVRQT